MADQLIFQIAYPLIHLYQGYSFFSMDCNSLVNEALGNSANISKLRLPKMGSFNENYIYLDTLCCWQFFIDTVYGISANKMITPRYAISYGNKKPGNEAFDNPEMLMSVTEKGTLLLTSLCESKNHFFLELVENRVRQRLLFNKASKSFTRLLGRDKLAHAPVLINDLDLGPDIWPDFVLNGKVMVKILYADELLLWNKALNQENRRCDITELKNITSEDNPVIMFINLK